MGLLAGAQEIDQKLSRRVHAWDDIVATTALYPFAAFFHPGLIWVAYLAVYHFSNHDLQLTLLYALATLLSLTTTYLLKRRASRARPELNLAMQKPHHFRKKEKNCSMPSGDSFQSAVFVVFLSFLGVNPVALLIFHVAVCLSRVYYLCHWLGDTVVSTLIGVVVSKAVLCLEETIFFQTLTEALL